MGVQGVTAVPAEVMWFSQEDVCRHALAAYAIAREAIKPPPGEPFWEGGPWCDGSDFAAHFLQAMVVRLHEQGQASGQPFHAMLACGNHAFAGV